MNDTDITSELLKHARKLNTRASELARKADLPYATAHKFLKGDMRRPTLETIEKIAAVFNLKLTFVTKYLAHP